MPGLSPLDDKGMVPEMMELRLPSFLNSAERLTGCTSGLPGLEDRLREAYASEALSDLRRQLRTRTFARKFKDENAVSQGSYTRMRALHDQIETKIRSARNRYSAARAALFCLRGPGEWEEKFRILQPGDIRAVNEYTAREEEENANRRAREAAGADVDQTLHTISTLTLRPGDANRHVSWIWHSVTSNEVDNDADSSLHDGIRLEWLKARARAERWREEVILLEEEMRRTLEYCDWRARWWEDQILLRTTNSSALNEGLHAYAKEQAETDRSRAVAWAARWAPVRNRAREALDDQLKESSGAVSMFEVIEVELEMQQSDDEWESDPE
jgi:hypothetical protein